MPRVARMPLPSVLSVLFSSVICEGYGKDNEVAVVDMMEGGGEFLSISKGL